LSWAREGKAAAKKRKMSLQKVKVSERMKRLPEKRRGLNTEFTEEKHRDRREEKKDCGVRS
jgi:hypothetical protein